MHARTIVLLVLVVAGLVWAVHWQQGREESGTFESRRPLVEGALAGRIQAIRVDHLERGLQLRLERDESGRWWIVDPIEYPAEMAVLDLLLEMLESQMAIEVEDAGDLSGLSLDPPRAVLEFEERIGADLVRRRIELGAVDLDQQHAWARVDGVVVRTLRSLDSTVERDLAGWRARSIFHGLRPHSVVELRRSGSVLWLGQDEQMDVALDAINDDGWRGVEPWGARFDPGFIGRMIQTAAYLRTQSFVDDAPGDLAFYGLEPPQMRLELVCADGRTEVLRLSRSGAGEDWLAASESSPHIYTVSHDDMLVLTTPIDMLVDREFVRASREGMASVRLEAGGRVVTLEQGRDGWTVSSTGGSSTGGLRELAPEPADGGRVEDLLGEIERARVLAFLPDVEWPSDADSASIRIDFDGRIVGGRLGPPHETVDGGRGVLFRREGDELVSLVDETLLEIAALDPEGLRTLQMVLVKELDVARIELATDTAERTYFRNVRGRWSRTGTEVEARKFAALVDGLLAVRALRHLPAREPAAGVDAVQVRIVPSTGPATIYELRAGTDGTIFASSSHQAMVAPELHRGLVELMGG